MSKREIQQPVTGERGEERHPAFGSISASRVSSTPGAVLFDSEVKHGHFVSLTIEGATRQRDINHDWIDGDSRPIVEVAMSEAQWASFVSSMNTSGVPCTLRYTREDGPLPDLPFAPRLAISQEETRLAADRAFAKVREAFAAVEEKPTKANIRNLGIVLGNAVPNIAFAADSLSEHAENVVQKARADVEAMVVARAAQMGLTAEDVAAIGSSLGEEDQPAIDG